MSFQKIVKRIGKISSEIVKRFAVMVRMMRGLPTKLIAAANQGRADLNAKEKGGSWKRGEKWRGEFTKNLGGFSVSFFFMS